MLTYVSEHFNSPGHTIQDFSFTPIENVLNNWKRLLKESSWMHILGTIAQKYMNSKMLLAGLYEVKEGLCDIPGVHARVHAHARKPNVQFLR